MDKTEEAWKAFFRAIDCVGILSERLPPECSSGHKWGTRSDADAKTGRFWCERCGHEESHDPSALAIQERISRQTVGR